MKKLSLKNAKNMLSRKEMKAINGGYYSTGGTCCARATGYETWCGLSKESAIAYASGGGNWCCDSCGSASWV